MARDRCRYTYPVQRYPDLGSGCCWRPVWNDRDRCIWHADADHKPSAELAEAVDGSGARLDSAILRKCNLDDADWPAGAVLVNADFERCSADGTDFTDADLRNADFSDASLRRARFVDANLEDADLCDSDLKGVAFEGARLHEADLSHSYIGQMTSFDDRIVYERYLEEAEEPGRRQSAFDAATWTYRELQYWCRENGLIDRTEEFFVREKDLRRRFAWNQDDYLLAIRAEGSRWLMGYGYQIKGILGASIGTIVLSTVLFPFIGGIRETRAGSTATYALGVPPEQGLGDVAFVFAKSFYLSLMSFTTLGIGDVAPASYPGQVLSVIAALIGFAFVALIISVLSRRRYWL